MVYSYYNEHDPYAAQWLRNLIKAGHIAPGFVDERSIEDVRPDELIEFTQCHFFAGIGVWSYALRQAGFPDSRQVWTGSCPCQPFSAAGKGKGVDDERHLWPAFHWLIQQCQPGIVFGEQVASKNGLAWLDIVQADLENTGYASQAVDLCAAGFGSPNIRQRLWFVAERVGDTIDQGLERHAGNENDTTGRQEQDRPATETGGSSGLADTDCKQHNGTRDIGTPGRDEYTDSGTKSRVADANGAGSQSREQATKTSRYGNSLDSDGGDNRPGPTNGFWRDVDWLGCRDGKWRPVRPGTFPLVNGAFQRVGRLRAYGNAINAQVAKEFIKSRFRQK